MSPTLDIQMPFDYSSATAVWRNPIEYVYPIQTRLTIIHEQNLMLEDSLEEVINSLSSKSSTTFRVFDLRTLSKDVISTDSDLSENYDFNVSLPIKASYKVKAKIKSVSKFTPKVFID